MDWRKTIHGGFWRRFGNDHLSIYLFRPDGKWYWIIGSSKERSPVGFATAEEAMSSLEERLLKEPPLPAAKKAPRVRPYLYTYGTLVV